ncbi:hypothetical protein E7Z59_07025 [Robertkochia marina]|uniref:Uncharacterized protein n=1 Tax=Robertkochia marina TaxID=1227945 RepID=A0A4S3M047_9FLAO|nr:hypothetical protein [Robertkochia marina]THD67407.1 hypothetical protein E7Z59_07025 [Robertkochia marina]
MNEPKDQAKYISCYNSFDSSLVNLIPKKIPNSYLSLGYASLDYFNGIDDYAGMYITTRITNVDELNLIRAKYSKEAKSIKHSLDSSLIVINTYGKLENSVQGNYNSEAPIPVPQYAICEPNESTHLWERIKDLEIIIVDYRFTDLLKRPDSKKRKDLPEELSTGFSKGITINKTNMTLQKWVIVW